MIGSVVQTNWRGAAPSYNRLSCAEREQIANLHAAGRSNADIARTLDRSSGSDIGRELSCNALPSAAYSPQAADGAYLERQKHDSILETNSRLRQFVVERLSEGWSPEQISGRLKSRAEAKLRPLGTKTIYAFVYRALQKAIELWRYLLRKRRTRRPMRARTSRDTIKNRRSIHDRPVEVETRQQVGHWEADLVICKGARPVLVLHERKIRITLVTRLSGKTAAKTISAMTAVFRRIALTLRSSMTFDNDPTLCPSRPASRSLRHDNIVLRRLRFLAKRRCRKCQQRLRTAPFVLQNPSPAVRKFDAMAGSNALVRKRTTEGLGRGEAARSQGRATSGRETR